MKNKIKIKKFFFEKLLFYNPKKKLEKLEKLEFSLYLPSKYKNKTWKFDFKKLESWNERHS